MFVSHSLTLVRFVQRIGYADTRIDSLGRLASFRSYCSPNYAIALCGYTHCQYIEMGANESPTAWRVCDIVKLRGTQSSAMCTSGQLTHSVQHLHCVIHTTPNGRHFNAVTKSWLKELYMYIE